MKTSTILKNSLALVILITVQTTSRAQVANWTFDGTLVGTGSSNTTVSNAVLGPGITLGDYNGNLYFGEGGWPAGSLASNAYLEFSVTPTAGHTMTLGTIVMNLRRSTTGTAAGSGPNNWSLRSSLDGYTADLTTGTLTLNTTPSFNYSFPAAFYNLSSKVTFRLYGYNAVVTSGGLSRFIYDNIAISGSTVLPVIIESFKAIAGSNHSVQLSWSLSGDGSVSSLNVERSGNGTDFSTIENIAVDPSSLDKQYYFTDAPDASFGSGFYYRIKMNSADGKTSYSAIQYLNLDGSGSFTIRGINGRTGGALQFMVVTSKADQYHFFLYNMNGTRVAAASSALSAGSQMISMDNMPGTRGMYILVAEHSGEQISAKTIIQ